MIMRPEHRSIHTSSEVRYKINPFVMDWCYIHSVYIPQIVPFPSFLAESVTTTAAGCFTCPIKNYPKYEI